VFSKRKVRAPADILARTLFDEFVEKQIPETRELLSGDAKTHPMLDSQIKLYQFASVLLAVLDAERRNKAFTPVRESLERCFFPPSFAEGATVLDELRHAMSDLASLIQPDGEPRPESWARSWLARVGIDESNPATLLLFAIRWPDHYVAVAKSLREFTPVA
jgi:hypothetical protein